MIEIFLIFPSATTIQDVYLWLLQFWPVDPLSPPFTSRLHHLLPPFRHPNQFLLKSLTLLTSATMNYILASIPTLLLFRCSRSRSFVSSPIGSSPVSSLCPLEPASHPRLPHIASGTFTLVVALRKFHPSEFLPNRVTNFISQPRTERTNRSTLELRSPWNAHVFPYGIQPAGPCPFLDPPLDPPPLSTTKRPQTQVIYEHLEAQAQGQGELGQRQTHRASPQAQRPTRTESRGASARVVKIRKDKRTPAENVSTLLLFHLLNETADT